MDNKPEYAKKSFGTDDGALGKHVEKYPSKLGKISQSEFENVPLSSIVESYSYGERRALARAFVKEIAPGLYHIYPFYLREICGPEIHWTETKSNEPILTGTEVTDLLQVADILAWWATVTVSIHASPYR
jgi:hypothetical protein